MILRNTFLLAGALALAAGGVLAVQSALDDTSGDVPPALPQAPARAGVDLLAAQPFVLDAPAIHQARLEQPAYDAGMVLVLDVAERELLYPRQVAMPVLLVGEQTVDRINVGYGSGRLVVVVPAPRAGGGVDLDLTERPIVFTEPGLSEQMDAGAIAAALADARAQGAAPPSAATVEQALQPDVLRFPDARELRAWAATLVEAHAPDEVDLVSGLRAPRLTR